jgi:hypothetical protein
LRPDSAGLDKPVVLWAVPRSRSTAFERIFVERDDFEVIHEPFSVTYYLSPDRRCNRFLEGAPDPRYGAQRVLDDVLRPRDRPVFVKDMAYHTTAFMSRAFVGNFTNTFLIRHPRAALASLHVKQPDFTFEEAGYEQLARLYDYATADGTAAPVIDADDLVRDPAGTVRAYCATVGIPFVAEALSWRPGKIAEFERWDSWHRNAQGSTGIGRADSQPRKLPAHLDEVHLRCLPYYERLLAAKLTPDDSALG